MKWDAPKPFKITVVLGVVLYIAILVSEVCAFGWWIAGAILIISLASAGIAVLLAQAVRYFPTATLAFSAMLYVCTLAYCWVGWR